MFTKKGIVDRFEEDYAIIHLEDGQKLLWERVNLPGSIKEGSEIVVEIKDLEEAHAEQQELAQEILQEIFNHAPH